MSNLSELEIRITEIRKRLHIVIEDKSNLKNREIIKISQELDNLLNCYKFNLKEPK